MCKQFLFGQLDSMIGMFYSFLIACHVGDRFLERKDFLPCRHNSTVIKEELLLCVHKYKFSANK